jgi:hypothetical protein
LEKGGLNIVRSFVENYGVGVGEGVRRVRISTSGNENFVQLVYSAFGPHSGLVLAGIRVQVCRMSHVTPTRIQALESPVHTWRGADDQSSFYRRYLI